MGQTTSCMYRAKIVMFGLDSAGKTTILYSLLQKELITPGQTIGFNFEQLNYKNIRYDVWDVGGKDEVRRLWIHYITGAAGLVFVVDSTDRSRMNLAAEELAALLSLEELRSATVLVLANKQDLPDAMDPEDVVIELGLSQNTPQTWCIEGTEAVNGNGLLNGLDWMSDTLIKSHQKSCCCSCSRCCTWKIPFICV